MIAANRTAAARDRKSTRLNSSHANISYAVFCLKKKNHTPETIEDVRLNGFRDADSRVRHPYCGVCIRFFQADFDLFSFFFFNDTATTEIYTLSLHDALPIFLIAGAMAVLFALRRRIGGAPDAADRKSTRLNSSHANISYAVFCLKKKKN